MAKTKRSKTHKVSIAGLSVIERELNRWQKASDDAEVTGNRAKMDDMDLIQGGVMALANRLDVSCSCRMPRGASRYARKYCTCKRVTRTKSTTPRRRGTMLSGARLDLAGNCRDKGGKFVPVRNCTGRGPAAKKKTKAKRKAKGK